MIKATLSGTECKVYDFKRDERGRLWCMVKCEYYNRPLPVYAGFIEVLNDENKVDNHARLPDLRAHNLNTSGARNPRRYYLHQD